MKIEVVYNAVATDLNKEHKNYQASSAVDSILNSKYILAVSSIDPRKNLQRLIDAFSIKIRGLQTCFGG